MRSNGRRGAAGQQYAIIVGLIGVVAIAAIAQLGGSIRQLFGNAANTMQTVTNTGGFTSGSGGAGSGTGGGNQPPTAGAVAFSTTLGGGAVFSATAILANASDPEGQPVTLVGVGAASSGAVALAGGSVTFTPAAGGEQSFQFTVSDGSQTATGTAAVTVDTPASCKALKTAHPALSGITAKTIKPSADAFPTLCDFTTYGGGWTLVALQFEADPIPWTESRQSDHDPLAVKSFALAGAEIPTHTHSAFGNVTIAGGSASGGMIDSIPLVYSTGALARTSYVSDNTTGRNYWIYRNPSQHYGGHDPDNTGNINTTTVWNNTLTFNRNDGSATSHTWAFSPQHTIQASRGYSYGGVATLDTLESFGWAVWVR